MLATTPKLCIQWCVLTQVLGNTGDKCFTSLKDLAFVSRHKVASNYLACSRIKPGSLPQQPGLHTGFFLQDPGWGGISNCQVLLVCKLLLTRQENNTFVWNARCRPQKFTFSFTIKKKKITKLWLKWQALRDIKVKFGFLALHKLCLH